MTKAWLSIAVLVSAILAGMPAQELCAVDMTGSAVPVERDSQTKTFTKTYEDKITEEREAIIADMRRLKEARKTRDKEKIAQVKQEVDQDIARRKATIKGLYNEMARRMGRGNQFEMERKGQ